LRRLPSGVGHATNTDHDQGERKSGTSAQKIPFLNSNECCFFANWVGVFSFAIGFFGCWWVVYNDYMLLTFILSDLLSQAPKQDFKKVFFVVFFDAWFDRSDESSFLYLGPSVLRDSYVLKNDTFKYFVAFFRNWVRILECLLYKKKTGS
jgi:hypothetical protein